MIAFSMGQSVEKPVATQRMRKTMETGEARQVRSWSEQITGPVSLRLVFTEDIRSELFRAFCDDLKQIASKVKVVEEEGERGKLPALLAGPGHRFHAVPRGGELPPFLELLSLQDREQTELPKPAAELLQKLEWPVTLKLYVTPQCPFCPQVLRHLNPLPLHSPLLKLDIIDGALFPELAASEAVRSVPTLILDEQFRWTGSIRLEEVLEALVYQDPARLSPEALVASLKEGEADRLVAMMLKRNQIFPAFLDLLQHAEWSVRLGAIVVAEEIAERNQKLAAELTMPLLAGLATATEALKGDLIYLLGVLGSAACIPVLDIMLAREEDEEMREVLRDSLDKCRKRS